MVLGITGKKLKILFVANEIYPDLSGGVHTYIYQIARGLVERGHTVHILTKKVKEESPKEEVVTGVSVHRYEVRKRKLAFLGQISWINSVRKEFSELNKSYNFDIVNLHSPHVAYAVNSSDTARGLHKVYTFHALLRGEEVLSARDKEYRWCSWRKHVKPFWFPIYLYLMKRLEKQGLIKSEKIITLSDYTSKCVIGKHKVTANKIVKISGAADIGKFKPAIDKNAARNIIGLPIDKNILFTVRRLVPRMGLDNLIRAMPAVLKKCPHTILLIGGEGPLKDNLKKLIDKLQLNRTVFLKSFIPDNELPSYYQAADLFVLPSKEMEGFGIVTVEALACGTPVLGTPVGGTVDILSKLDSGLLFRDTSEEAITDLITDYLLNETKRNEIASRCRQFVLGNYSWKEKVKQTEDLFLSVAQ